MVWEDRAYMRITIIGAGPAGLYLAYLLKRRRADLEVRIFEQNRPNATFGFGVVFSDRALEFLNDDDPESYAAIGPHLVSWEDISVVHRGERIQIDGVGFAAIERLGLLQLLQERVRSVGVEPRYEHAVDTLEQLDSADLVVGADGVNSLVRRTYQREFGTIISHSTNRFAWFGTTRPFDALTQTFRHNEIGYFNAHHYRYAPDMSTFIIELDAATFRRAGFERTSEIDARLVCQRVFAEELAGHQLISNHSLWRRFPRIWNERWSHKNYVLIGDALHTAHFSIGSGTRLAMEDAIALDKALAQHSGDVPSALAAFEASRRPIVEKLVAAANASGDWYEHFADHMALEPIDFAMSYVTRSGRISLERLRAISPGFVSRYVRERPLARRA
jgi:2-polyprenyl-6-methoxyphenol hydroxylase-like FAD-dependent oxidoreductase